MEKKSKDSATKNAPDPSLHDLCMGLVVEQQGNFWCCDGVVDTTGDLEEQGCWPMEDEASHAYR